MPLSNTIVFMHERVVKELANILAFKIYDFILIVLILVIITVIIFWRLEEALMRVVSKLRDVSAN